MELNIVGWQFFSQCCDGWDSIIFTALGGGQWPLWDHVTSSSVNLWHQLEVESTRYWICLITKIRLKNLITVLQNDCYIFNIGLQNSQSSSVPPINLVSKFLYHEVSVIFNNQIKFLQCARFWGKKNEIGKHSQYKELQVRRVRKPDSWCNAARDEV